MTDHERIPNAVLAKRYRFAIFDTTVRAIARALEAVKEEDPEAAEAFMRFVDMHLEHNESGKIIPDDAAMARSALLDGKVLDRLHELVEDFAGRRRGGGRGE